MAQARGSSPVPSPIMTRNLFSKPRIEFNLANLTTESILRSIRTTAIVFGGARLGGSRTEDGCLPSGQSAKGTTSPPVIEWHVANILDGYAFGSYLQDPYGLRQILARGHRQEMAKAQSNSRSRKGSDT